MQNFQGTFETRKRLFVSAFPICMAVPLTNLTCCDCQIPQHWEYSSFLLPNFAGVRGLILVLMLNLCCLTVMLIFLVVTWWLLLVTARFLVVSGGYCSLPLMTARFHFQYERSKTYFIIVPLNSLALIAFMRNNDDIYAKTLFLNFSRIFLLVHFMKTD